MSTDFKLTNEQVDILSSFNNKTKDTKILAYAGSGKTFILGEIAKTLHSQGKRGIYLAFNKALADEAGERFGEYVETKTIHSVAFRGTAPNLCSSPKHLVDSFQELGISKYEAWNVYETLSKFCKSNDTAVGSRHTFCDRNIKRFGIKELSGSKGEQLAKDAQKVWDAYIKNGSNLCSHDMYIKRYSMGNCESLQDLDYILFDEAQDANPVMIDILNKVSCPVIIVGDEYQQIYSFTGAINSLSNFNFKTYHISKSFRWGEDIGELSNIILGPVMAKGSKPVLGDDNLSTEVLYDSHKPISEFDAVLFRTNKEMVKQGILLYNKGYNVSISKASMLLKEFQDLISFRDGHKKSFCGFKKWSEFIEAAKEVGVYQHTWLAFMLKDRSTDAKIYDFLSHCSKGTGLGVDLRTMHSSKGLEWDNVLVWDDYRRKGVGGSETKINKEDLRLLYVACTRAKKELHIRGVSKNTLKSLVDNVEGGYCD